MSGWWNSVRYTCACATRQLGSMTSRSINSKDERWPKKSQIKIRGQPNSLADPFVLLFRFDCCLNPRRYLNANRSMGPKLTTTVTTTTVASRRWLSTFDDRHRFLRNWPLFYLFSLSFTCWSIYWLISFLFISSCCNRCFTNCSVMTSYYFRMNGQPQEVAKINIFFFLFSGSVFLIIPEHRNPFNIL